MRRNRRLAAAGVAAGLLGDRKTCVAEIDGQN